VQGEEEQTGTSAAGGTLLGWVGEEDAGEVVEIRSCRHKEGTSAAGHATCYARLAESCRQGGGRDTGRRPAHHLLPGRKGGDAKAALLGCWTYG
jgi:hypothetical protein